MAEAAIARSLLIATAVGADEEMRARIARQPADRARQLPPDTTRIMAAGLPRFLKNPP